MTIISILILLASLCGPFLIFLDFHKRNTIYIGVIYVLVFFFVVFLTFRIIVVYHYGMILAGLVPFMLFFLCLVKKKH
ncbi:MAG: hypothetical protein ACO1N0_16410 [Fluviicola sp.]